MTATPNSIPSAVTKIGRVLAALLPGHSFNRVEAERESYDRCLNSTISEIERRYGIAISRKYEAVPAYKGYSTR